MSPFAVKYFPSNNVLFCFKCPKDKMSTEWGINQMHRHFFSEESRN